MWFARGIFLAVFIAASGTAAMILLNEAIIRIRRSRRSEAPGGDANAA
jgi:hypothetical protein